MEIKEVLNIKRDDIYNFNLYLASLNKNLGMVFAGSIIVLLGIYGVMFDGQDALLLNILIIVVGLIGIALPFVLNKYIIRRKIRKIDFEDLPPVEVTLNEEGILYRYINEKDAKDLLPFAWSEILRAVEKDDYIYIHLMDKRSIMIITLKDVNEEAFKAYLKEKLDPQRRYFETKKNK